MRLYLYKHQLSHSTLILQFDAQLEELGSVPIFSSCVSALIDLVRGEFALKYGFFALLLLLVACSSQAPTYPVGFENASGQTLLAEGLARHEVGKFEEALVFFDAAYSRFSEVDNKEKMAETLSAKSLTLRRLGRFEEAVTILEQAVDLTEGTGGVVLPLYNLAKTQEALGSPNCVETYRSALAALEEYQPYPHYRPAVVNDMVIHIAVAELSFDMDANGDAEQRILNAIDALIADEELDDFGRMVWVSGGYIGLTRYYIPINPTQAWSYFDQAEEIVYAYPDTATLRRQDIEALRAEMPPRP